MLRLECRLIMHGIIAIGLFVAAMFEDSKATIMLDTAFSTLNAVCFLFFAKQLREEEANDE